MATPSFAVPHRASGADAYASDACPFVARGGSPMLDDDNELLSDADSGVFRSTPLQPCSSFAPMNQNDHYTSSMDVTAPEYVSSGGMTASTWHRDVHTQLGRKVEFSSIAEDYPLAATTKVGPAARSIISARVSSAVAFRPCGVEAAATAAQIARSRTTSVSNAVVGGGGGGTTDFSVSGRITPVLTPMLDDTQPDEMTVVYRTNSIERESDDDRKSPFGNTVLQPPKLYEYPATKTEVDDMEILRWGIQEKVFSRYFALQQREPQWGSLEMRDSRLMFHPGKRREAIMHEKKFHEATYREGITDGDAAWYRTRRAQFTEMYREFCREEMKYKQETMLTRLEKTSTFSKFPILGNRFLLVRLLGKGGNGEVWTVIDYADNKRSCALKLSTSVKHAQHEHFTHSRLSHPNIVKVGNAAYLMEYRQQFYTAFTVDSVDTDLQQLIEIYEHFDECSALKVLLQLLKALTYLHNEMEIAHYDIKPSNILITDDECVKLTDFDLARDVHEPISSSSVGTLRYLPPECFRPRFGDCGGTAEKADIWMVGIVYCLMLWGKHPICHDKSSHDDAKESLAAYTGQLAYSRPVSNLSQWIIRGCLHPDPRCRPMALQLLQALEASSIQPRTCA